MATNNNNTSGASAREARRRKILERGSGRLALITGRIQTLPSESQNKLDAELSQPSISIPEPSNQTTASPVGDDKGFGFTSPSDDPAPAAGRSESISEPPLHMCEMAVRPSGASDLDEGNTEQSPLASLSDQMPTVSTSGTVQNLESRTRLNGFVTPSQIKAAIAATERSRLFCSVMIALFVVLSSLGFPILGSSVVKSVISYRPLYLLLLTNVTLVLARLLANGQRSLGRTVAGGYNILPTGQDWVEHAGKALEVGLVMQKAMDAVLMDCSVYAIIIIAGFSLVK